MLPDDVEDMLANLRRLRTYLSEWSEGGGPQETHATTVGGVQASATLDRGVVDLEIDSFWFGQVPITRVEECIVEAINGAERASKDQVWQNLIDRSIVDREWQSVADSADTLSVTDLISFPERIAERARKEQEENTET